jgi:hypothetical protein
MRTTSKLLHSLQAGYRGAGTGPHLYLAVAYKNGLGDMFAASKLRTLDPQSTLSTMSTCKSTVPSMLGFCSVTVSRHTEDSSSHAVTRGSPQEGGKKLKPTRRPGIATTKNCS